MLFCEECGAKLEDGAKFCEECGAVLEPIMTMNASELKSSEEADSVVHKDKIHGGRGKKTKIIVATCLALCIVCLGGVILWGTIMKKDHRGNDAELSKVAQNTEKNTQSSECLNTEDLCEDESESVFSTEKQTEVETEQDSEPLDNESEEDMYTSNSPYDEENEGENTYVDEEDYSWDDEEDYSWDDEEYDWDYDYSNGNELCAGRYVPSDGAYGDLSISVFLLLCQDLVQIKMRSSAS